MCSFPLLVDTMCSHLSQFLAWRTSSSLNGNCQAIHIELKAQNLLQKQQIYCLLWSPAYLIPLLHPLSCFSLWGLFPSSSPSVAGKPTCHSVGTAIWRRRQCQMVQGIIYRPFCISPRVVLALSTVLTHCSLQPPPALILLGSWFKAPNLFPPCSDLVARAEMNPDNALYAHAISKKSETSVETHLLSGCWNVGVLLCKKSTSLPWGFLLLN